MKKRKKRKSPKAPAKDTTPPKEPTYSGAEMSAAKQREYAQGHEDGLAVGQRIAKLESFAVIADHAVRNGSWFQCHPSVAQYVLPLVLDKLEQLGADIRPKSMGQRLMESLADTALSWLRLPSRSGWSGKDPSAVTTSDFAQAK